VWHSHPYSPEAESSSDDRCETHCDLRFRYGDLEQLRRGGKSIEGCLSDDASLDWGERSRVYMCWASRIDLDDQSFGGGLLVMLSCCVKSN
jgi:hypothetical protein